MKGCEPQKIDIADQGNHKSRNNGPNHVPTCTLPIIGPNKNPPYAIQLQLIARDNSMGDR